MLSNPAAKSLLEGLFTLFDSVTEEECIRDAQTLDEKGRTYIITGALYNLLSMQPSLAVTFSDPTQQVQKAISVVLLLLDYHVSNVSEEKFIRYPILLARQWANLKTPPLLWCSASKTIGTFAKV